MSKRWSSGSGAGSAGLHIEELLGEFRITNGSAYVGGEDGERDARVSRLERILIAGDVPDRDSLGFVWSTRTAAEAALGRA
jgi:hypothetical protein